jgi:hypothetical protein
VRARARSRGWSCPTTRTTSSSSLILAEMWSLLHDFSRHVMCMYAKYVCMPSWDALIA